MKQIRKENLQKEYRKRIAYLGKTAQKKTYAYLTTYISWKKICIHLQERASLDPQRKF